MTITKIGGEGLAHFFAEAVQKRPDTSKALLPTTKANCTAQF